MVAISVSVLAAGYGITTSSFSFIFYEKKYNSADPSSEFDALEARASQSSTTTDQLLQRAASLIVAIKRKQ
jgi:hypothetical protein